MAAITRASAGPDSDAFGFDLDAPTSGLASRCRALMARNRNWCHGVYHRCYKRRILSQRRRLPASLPAPSEYLLWRQPVSRGKLGNHCALRQRLLEIRALSPLENQRRRPVSVITSSRRAVTSGLSVWSRIE